MVHRGADVSRTRNRGMDWRRRIGHDRDISHHAPARFERAEGPAFSTDRESLSPAGGGRVANRWGERILYGRLTEGLGSVCQYSLLVDGRDGSAVAAFRVDAIHHRAPGGWTASGKGTQEQTGQGVDQNRRAALDSSHPQSSGHCRGGGRCPRMVLTLWR